MLWIRTNEKEEDDALSLLVVGFMRFHVRETQSIHISKWKKFIRISE